MPKEIGDRTKETYSRLFNRVNNEYNVNYFCTDGLDTYTTKRFASNKKKEERYFNEEYYRKIDKRMELIKNNKNNNKKNKNKKNKENKKNKKNKNIINNISNSNIINFKDIIKNNIEDIKNEKEYMDCVNGYIISYSNKSISYINSNTLNNLSFKDYLENITNTNNSKNNKTIQGKLKVKKKIMERNKYKNIDGFAIHIANKSETCLIESINSLIRNYLARFNRKQGWKMICLHNHFSLRPTEVC